MRHMKPSVKARRNGWVALVILELIGAYAALYALSGQTWYDPSDVLTPTVSAYSTAPSSINVGYLAKDMQLVLTIVVWTAYSALVAWSLFHDWPVTDEGADVYDATHVSEARHIQPVLKMGDDLAAILRNKGSGTHVASTLYDDYQAIKTAKEPPKTKGEVNGDGLGKEAPPQADKHEDVVPAGVGAVGSEQLHRGPDGSAS